MRILLGTTNASKVKYFAQMLKGVDAEFVTLRDLGITEVPGETGRDPKENAMIKAAFYGKYAEFVIAQDSALYIRSLPLDDPRQPGLNVRRAPDGHERTDDEMLADYAALAHSLGGRMTCAYLSALAVCARGNTQGFMDTGAVNDVYAFYMVDTPHENRHPGWPLDSLSVDRRTGKYCVEPDWRAGADQYTAREKQLIEAYERERRAFLVGCLGLSENSEGAKEHDPSKRVSDS